MRDRAGGGSAAHVATEHARAEAATHLVATRKALREQLNLAANSLGQFPQTEGLREKFAQKLLGSYRPLVKRVSRRPQPAF